MEDSQKEKSEPILVVDNLKRRFGNNRAVDGASFKVYPGVITGIIGPNGAGKTTCFNCIYGEIKLNSGKVRFENSQISGKKPNNIYKLGMHRTFQIPGELGTLSLIENLMMPASNQTGERFGGPIALFKRVQREERELFDKAMEMLKITKLEKLAFEPAATLSGGQRKLLEFARSLMDEPRMVLLDEPTAGVNPTLARELGELMLNVCEKQKVTMLMISHDMAVTQAICKRVLVMANGKVLAEGTPREVMDNVEVQRAYLGRSTN